MIVGSLKNVKYDLIEDGKEYLVKWEGYQDCDNTWEPVSSFNSCMWLLKEFD